ncbi:CPXCG motif-containing cysteine-rich protein [Robiginitalea sp.]|uniref:CPXCG motif-containing cysteine-rich protein n=1 Tax=Robiginitalea sp. TaxID=1902411 RepID=UPI003C751621
MIEHFVQCPYCWESISILIDTSIPEQDYVEDCEVCCNPIEFYVRSADSRVLIVEVRELGQ